MNKFQLNEKQLIENFISKHYLPNIFNLNQKNKEWIYGDGIEFIIRPECNQKCKYCYITQYGDELYPKEKRVSKETLLYNLELFLNLLIENKIYVTRIELFAGDLFIDNFYFDIISIFEKCYSKVPKQERDNNFQKWGDIQIITPCNCYFFQFEDYQNRLKEITKKMSDNYHIVLGFSWSTDGLYSSNVREETVGNKKITQEYYDKIFAFNHSMKYGMHPMVSPEGIKDAINNFDWWVEMYKKYNITNIETGNVYPCMLEVRNSYWTDEDLKEFSKLIRHIWDYKLKLNGDSVKKLTKHLFIGDGQDGTLGKLPFYDICQLTPEGLTSRDDIGCSMAAVLRINLADLSLPICHRLTYPQFIGGQFQIEDNKIIGIIPKNVSGYLQIRTLSPRFFPKCHSCNYELVCMKGCLGAQYEYSGELFNPIPAVCKLEQVKTDTLLELYNSYGVLKEAIDNDYIEDKKFEQWLILQSKEKGLYNER